MGRAPRASEVLQGPPTQGHIKMALELRTSTIHPKLSSSHELLIVTVDRQNYLYGGLAMC